MHRHGDRLHVSNMQLRSPGGIDCANEACEAAVGVGYLVVLSWLVDEHDISGRRYWSWRVGVKHATTTDARWQATGCYPRNVNHVDHGVKK
jgi:hypothetical protein